MNITYSVLTIVALGISLSSCTFAYILLRKIEEEKAIRLKLHARIDLLVVRVQAADVAITRCVEANQEFYHTLMSRETAQPESTAQQRRDMLYPGYLSPGGLPGDEPVPSTAEQIRRRIDRERIEQAAMPTQPSTTSEPPSYPDALELD